MKSMIACTLKPTFPPNGDDMLFVGRMGGLSVIVRADDNHVPEPGEPQQWLLCFKPKGATVQSQQKRARYAARKVNMQPQDAASEI